MGDVTFPGFFSFFLFLVSLPIARRSRDIDGDGFWVLPAAFGIGSRSVSLRAHVSPRLITTEATDDLATTPPADLDRLIFQSAHCAAIWSRIATGYLGRDVDLFTTGGFWKRAGALVFLFFFFLLFELNGYAILVVWVRLGGRAKRTDLIFGI